MPNLRSRVTLAATAVVLLAAAAPARAQAPSLSIDTQFAPPSGIAKTDFPPPGTVGNFRDIPAAVAVHGDRVYTVGVTGSGDGQDIAIVARRPDGAFDGAFSGDGKLTVSIGTEADIGTGIAVLPDGRLRVLAATDRSVASDTSFDVAVVGLNGDGTPDPAFGAPNANGVQLKIVVDGPSNEFPSRIEAGPGDRLAIVGSRTESTPDDFLALLEADGSPVTGPSEGFGTTGVRFSGTASPVDRGVDVAFRPGGGLVVSTALDHTTADEAVLRAFKDDGTVDPAFGTAGELVVGNTDTVPGGLIVHGGRLWVSGSTKVGTDTDAFIARANPDGSGLQVRLFDLRGRFLPAPQAVLSRAGDLVVAPGAPETLVAVGSVNYTFEGQTFTDWAAAAFNGLDGDLASAGFGDIVMIGAWSGELLSVAAGPGGWVAVAGTHLENADNNFGNARLLVDADKACDLAVAAGEPGEIVFRGSSPAALTVRVQNVGTRPCAGTVTLPPPYGMTPVETGAVAPGATFTAAALPVTYQGAPRADDALEISLAAPGDTNPANNLAVAHVVFSHCDLAVEPVGRAGAIPTEGTRRFEVSLRNKGTVACRVRIGSKPPYELARGRAASDAVAVAAPPGARPGQRVDVVLRASAAEDADPSNNAVTVSATVVRVSDSDVRSWGARRFAGRARKGAGQLPASRLRPARVDVAVLRERGGRCAWLRSTDGGFTDARRGREGDCGRPRWLRAEGTTSWRLTLRRALPPGRYVVYSRATSGAGFHEARFSAGDRNRVAFRVG